MGSPIDHNGLTREEIDKTFRDSVGAVKKIMDDERVDEIPAVLSVTSVDKEDEMHEARLVLPVLPDDDDITLRVFYGVGKTYYQLTEGCVPVMVCYSREVWLRGTDALKSMHDTAAEKARDVLKNYREGILVRAQTFDSYVREAVILLTRREDNSMQSGPVLYLGYSDYNTQEALFVQESAEVTLSEKGVGVDAEGIAELNTFYQGVAAGIAGVKDDDIKTIAIESSVSDEKKSLSDMIRFAKEGSEPSDKKLPPAGKNLFGKN